MHKCAWVAQRQRQSFKFESRRIVPNSAYEEDDDDDCTECIQCINIDAVHQ